MTRPFHRRLARRFQRAAAGVSTLPEKAFHFATGGAYVSGLPDFLGIGAQKGGTTWINEMLKRHPEVWVPEEQDLHYFDQRFQEPLRYYAADFAPAGSRLRGENTPAYALLPTWKIRFIRRVCPGIRLFMILRDPIDRAWSHARMGLAKDQRRRVEDVPEEEWLAHFNSRRSVARGHYTRTLERWERVFGEGSVCVLFYDDVSADPQSLLTELLAHIGASVPADWAPYDLDRRVNKGPSAPIPGRYRAHLLRLYGKELGRLSLRFGERVSHWGSGTELS